MDREYILGRLLEALEIIERCKEFVEVIPEVRTNLVFCGEDAKDVGDIAGIEGRITVINGFPQASGRPKFGASSHLARLLLEMRKWDSSIRSAINFVATPELIDFLKGYVKDRGWVLGVIDRRDEPEEVKEKEKASMPWKVEKLYKHTGGVTPKIFYETGAVGKEDLVVLVGSDPVEVAKEACKIAKRFIASKSTAKVGKIDYDEFTQFLLKRLGAENPKLIVPPLTGVDAGVVDIGNGKVLVIAEDPIFVIPGLDVEVFGWYTVHIGASDVAVMGVKPEFMLYTLLMPPDTPKEIFERIVNSIHNTAKELGIAIVGGHTGYYPGIASPLIGGITVFGITEKDKFVATTQAQVGDKVIVTKGPAVEAIGILSVVREKELLEHFPKDIVQKAKELIYQMTVVKDALIAYEVGGVTSMHDATEGGLIGGLFEVANASKKGIIVYEEKIPVYPEVEAICKYFHIDPMEAISEGTLIITAKPEKATEIVKALEKEGIMAGIVGEITEDETKKVLITREGKEKAIRIPKEDPFWRLFFEGLEG